jgi:hypothetical protein
MHSNDYKSDVCKKNSRHNLNIIVPICMVISFLVYLINSHVIKGFIINIKKFFTIIM